MAALIPLPSSLIPFLEPYLPEAKAEVGVTRPFVTMTYAASLDSRIAAKRGVQTVISHLETKTMTHYLRSKHDAILVGAGTFEADDPGLNCRYPGVIKGIRPIIVDPELRSGIHKASRVMRTAEENMGKAPFIITTQKALDSHDMSEFRKTLEDLGGRFIVMEYDIEKRLNWNSIFAELHKLEIKSVMVEGGANVINDLLSKAQLGEVVVDSVVITVAPLYLGEKGVQVAPPQAVRLREVNWWSGTEDAVLAARLS